MGKKPTILERRIQRAKTRLRKQLDRSSDTQKEMFIIIAEWLQDHAFTLGYNTSISIILKLFKEMTGDE